MGRMIAQNVPKPGWLQEQMLGGTAWEIPRGRMGASVHQCCFSLPQASQRPVLGSPTARR